MSEFNEKDYKNTFPFPNKETFKKFNLYRGGRVLLKGATFSDINKSNLFSDEILVDSGYGVEREAAKVGILVETIFDEEAYKTAKRKYNEESTELHTKFKTDLEREFDVTGNPKADACFSLAWEYGHSSGFSEVRNYYMDLVCLIN